MKNVKKFGEFLNESNKVKRNYLTPSDETLDKLDKNGIYDKLNDFSDRMYKAQVNNDQAKLDLLDQASEYIRNFAIKKGLIKESVNVGRINEASLKNTEFTKETVKEIEKAIFDTGSGAAEDNFVKTGSDSAWEDIMSNKNKLKIGHIMATSFSLLVSLVEGKTIRRYVSIGNYETTKQRFSQYANTYIQALSSIDDYPQARKHKKNVYDASSVNESTVVLDAMEPDNKLLKNLLKKHNVKMVILSQDGPTGFPEVELSGKREDLEAVLASPHGWDDDDLGEYIEESVKSVNEGRTITKFQAEMMGKKVLNKISIGTTFVTGNGNYVVTGYGQKSNAFQEYDAEKDGEPKKVKLTAMYGVKLEVSDDPRSSVYRNQEVLDSIILESRAYNESENLNEGLRQAGKELLDLKAMLNDEDSEILAAIYKQDGKKDRILTDQISKLYKKLRALSDKGYNLINMNESKEYQDSIDATDDMETIASLLNKHELMNWAKQTDLNYPVSTVRALKAAQKAYDKFYEEMLKAE